MVRQEKCASLCKEVQTLKFVQRCFTILLCLSIVFCAHLFLVLEDLSSGLIYLSTFISVMLYCVYVFTICMYKICLNFACCVFKQFDGDWWLMVVYEDRGQ